MILDVIYGFLGSGKTTFIQNILHRWGAEERIVVLVNEFGDVGIDGELLQGQDGQVVEMPSGCICCTLQADFRMQLLEICQTIKPERVVIEPTGVATISQIQSIVQAEMFQDCIQAIHYVFIADATSLMDLYKANRAFVESQIGNADLALLQKCDLVDKRMAQVTKGVITSINPNISVLISEFGRVDWEDYLTAIAEIPANSREKGRDVSQDLLPHMNDVHAADDHPEHQDTQSDRHHVHPEMDALGYESMGRVFQAATFDKSALEQFFRELRGTSSFGEYIVRAKGIIQQQNGAILLELA
mgnify:CR=1 FL=1